MGIGFTAALMCMGLVREVLGAGVIDLTSYVEGLKIEIPFLKDNPILIFILPPGGFFVFGMLMACVNKLAEKKGKPKAELNCGGCPMKDNCARLCEKKEAEE